MILAISKLYDQKTAILSGLLAVFIFFGFFFNVGTVNACGGYDYYDPCQSAYSGCDYGCGGYDYYDPCDYGCGYSQPTYYDPGYQYVQYPYSIYHQTPQPQSRGSQYNYVQYPYMMYHYFQNPTPASTYNPYGNGNNYSQYSTPVQAYNSSGNNYTQYPYPMYNYYNNQNISAQSGGYTNTPRGY